MVPPPILPFLLIAHRTTPSGQNMVWTRVAKTLDRKCAKSGDARKELQLWPSGGATRKTAKLAPPEKVVNLFSGSFLLGEGGGGVSFFKNFAYLP